MKKLFTSALILFLMIAMQLFGQTKTVVLADSIGNSKSDSVTVEVDPTVDSLKVHLFALGEVDLDSLDVKFGVTTPRFEYQAYRQQATYLGSSDTTYSKTLTVNLDSAGTSYTTEVTTIPKSAFAGYTQVQLKITSASSGNTATDPKQKYVLIVEKW